MERPLGTILLLALAAIAPAACGRGAPSDEVPTREEGRAKPYPPAAAGPVLIGRARSEPGRSRGGLELEVPGPRAEVGSDARIRIPPGATWGSVVAALRASAQLRREREQLPEGTPMLVDLPDVEGYVIVGGSRSDGSTGLDLVLGPAPGSVRIDAVGTGWIAWYGCEAELGWRAEGWSLDSWREALARLRETGAATEDGVRIDADHDAPAASVLPFVAKATSAGLGAVHVRTDDRRGWENMEDAPLRWLTAHQAPTGAWDDEVALGICDRHRMRHVPLGTEPEQVANAGQTGLCLLPFLGAGYTNRGKHAYARVVSRGLRHLKNVQRPDGSFPGAADWSDAVAHGFASIAMVEVYGMTGSPIWKGSAQRALDACSRVWWACGDDPLATALTALALCSAQLINADSVRRGRPAPLVVGEKLVREVLAEAERYDTRSGDLRAVCGLLARILLDPKARKSEEIEAGALCAARALDQAGAELDPICMWLSTLVCFQVGKEAWKRQQGVLARTVVGTERRDGHACCFQGSWDPATQLSVPGGRVSTTAAHALSLESSYCHSCVYVAR